MRWKARPERPAQPAPKVGDIRVFKEFAIFPTRAEGQRIWLEKVYAVREYVTWSEMVDCGYMAQTSEDHYAWRLVDYFLSFEAAEAAAVARVSALNGKLEA